MFGAFFTLVTVGLAVMNPGAAALIAGTVVLGNMTGGDKKK